MKPISLDHFTKYSFLSNLNVLKDRPLAVFVQTCADTEHNDYTQRLWKMNLNDKSVHPVTDFMKRVNYFLLNDGLYLVKPDEHQKGIATRCVKVSVEDGTEAEGFCVPCAVSSLQDFDDTYWLAQISINRSCPDYHHLSDEERSLVDQTRKDNEDYVVFDEYPFFFNGAGIINGNRETLVLIDKVTHEIIDLIPKTIDVESFDVMGDEIIFSGVDFTDVKGKWSWVWKVNAHTRTLSVLYDEVMQIARVFELNGKIIVLGTFAKEYGAMEANQFYELKDGKMHLVLKNEYAMYNSIGSDCRYGLVKNYLKAHDKAYFITVDHSRSIVVEFDGTSLKKTVDFEGSCDDVSVSEDAVYVIGMKDQTLQEVIEVRNAEVKTLTHFNEEVLKDHYVAKPMAVTVDKKMKVDGWVLLPKDYDPQKSYPAILDIHGGPKTAYGEVFYHEMQHWASLGYFVMFCNPRGSDGKGNAFADLRRSWGTIDYEDIMDFVDEVLKRYPQIDEKRLGVTGGSYGGYMTNWIIGHTNRFQCAASQRSISNWITEVCASDYGIDFPIEQEYDDLYHCHDELWEMSPLKYANEAVTPTLFIQSTEDYRCPIPEAIQMYTVLKCHGVESKLVAFKGENHDLSRTGKPLHRVRRLKEITEWMNRHLNMEE